MCAALKDLHKKRVSRSDLLIEAFDALCDVTLYIESSEMKIIFIIPCNLGHFGFFLFPRSLYF